MIIEVVVEIDVDVDAWAREYMIPIGEVPADVRKYVRHAVDVHLGGMFVE
jgi:hypothetical protein